MPLAALRSRQWFKLICGASQHHVPLVEHLAQVYTLAGADCIDVAADPAVVRAAVRGIREAAATPPLVMASFNDGADPHFRKVELSQPSCPATCPQPCVSSCPADAITSQFPVEIAADLCFGCGRCLPLCPTTLLIAHERLVSPALLLPELVSLGINALEIHTQIGRQAAFKALWQQVQPWLAQMQVISISFNDGDHLRAYLTALWEIMQPLPAATSLIWQVDGRPMSGDIGDGTTRATLRLARKVLSWQLPGYVQLAGGTNGSTWARSQSLPIAGIAYGSYARQLVSNAVSLDVAVQQARQLVAPLKSSVYEETL